MEKEHCELVLFLIANKFGQTEFCQQNNAAVDSTLFSIQAVLDVQSLDNTDWPRRAGMFFQISSALLLLLFVSLVLVRWKAYWKKWFP